MLDVKLNGARDFAGKRLEKLQRVISLTRETVNCKEFEQSIKGYKWAYSKGIIRKRYFEVHNFRWNDGMTRDQIFNLFMSGREVGSSADKEIDVDITLVMARHNGVLGYTYPNTVRTWIYSWFFDSATEAEIVGNIVHEWCHKIGFDHEYRWNSQREFTVPYAIGYMAERIASKLAKKTSTL